MEKDSPVQLSNLALRHLMSELQSLENGFVNKIQGLDNGWLKIKVHTKNGDKSLIITPNVLFISKIVVPAKQNPGGFSAFLKKYLFNQRIVSLKQNGLDRIVLFEFPEKILVIELFAKGNIILCDKDMKIIRAMRKEEWKDRKLEANETYKFPSSRGINPLDETDKAFYQKLHTNKKTFFGACVEILNVAPLVLERVFDEAKANLKQNASEVTQPDASVVLNHLKKIYGGAAEGAYVHENNIYSVRIGQNLPLVAASVNECLTNAYEKYLLASGGEKKEDLEEKEAAEEEGHVKVRRDIAKVEQAIEEKKKQIAQLMIEEVSLKEKGEKLFLKYEEISQVLKAIIKARALGIAEDETKERINSLKPMIEELNFASNRLKLRL